MPAKTASGKSTECTWEKVIHGDAGWQQRWTAHEQRQIGAHNEGVKTHCPARGSEARP